MRPERDRPGQLHPLAQAIRQGARHRLADVGDLQEVDDLLGLAAVGEFLLLGAAEPVQRPGNEVVLQQVVAPDHDVVEHGHVAEQGQVLEGPADAEIGPVVGLHLGDVTALEQHLPLGGGVAAGDAVEHRGLAGAVGADDRKQLALADAEADMTERPDTAEVQGYVSGFQNGALARHASSSLQAAPFRRLFLGHRRCTRSRRRLQPLLTTIQRSAGFCYFASKGLQRGGDPPPREIDRTAGCAIVLPTPTPPGNAAPTKTPTVCSDRTSQREPTSDPSPMTTLKPPPEGLADDPVGTAPAAIAAGHAPGL